MLRNSGGSGGEVGGGGGITGVVWKLPPWGGLSGEVGRGGRDGGAKHGTAVRRSARFQGVEHRKRSRSGALGPKGGGKGDGFSVK